jgi:hypothetical protein
MVDKLVVEKSGEIIDSISFSDLESDWQYRNPKNIQEYNYLDFNTQQKVITGQVSEDYEN